MGTATMRRLQFHTRNVRYTWGRRERGARQVRMRAIRAGRTMIMSETMARPIVVLFLTSESVEDAAAQNAVGFGRALGAGTPHDW